MSNVIDSFLVALGFEVDDKSTKESKAAIDGMKTNALQMGALLSAAFLGVDYAAKKSAQRIDDVYKSSKLLGSVGVSDLDKYRHAFTLVGGSAEDAEATLSSFETLLANAKSGKGGPFKELQMAGIPASFLTDTRTSIDLLKKLADIYPTLNDEQKILASDALNLNRGADLLLREGSKQIDAYLADAEKLGVISDKQGENAAKLVDAQARLSRAMDGVMNAFTGEAAVGMADAINDLANAISNLQETGGSVGSWFTRSYKEIMAIAGIGAAATAAGVAGKTANMVGAKTVGKGLTLGAKGLARTIPPLFAASLWNVDEDIKDMTGFDLKENDYTGWLFRPMNQVFGGEQNSSLRTRRDVMDYRNQVPTDSDIRSGRDGSSSTTENHYQISNKIDVHESGNSQETARAVIREMTKETAKATESIKTNVAG